MDAAPYILNLSTETSYTSAAIPPRKPAPVPTGGGVNRSRYFRKVEEFSGSSRDSGAAWSRPCLVTTPTDYLNSVCPINLKSLCCLTRPWSTFYSCYVRELCQPTFHPPCQAHFVSTAGSLLPRCQPRQADHSTASERASEHAGSWVENGCAFPWCQRRCADVLCCTLLE
jgi:hypothetical protein